MSKSELRLLESCCAPLAGAPVSEEQAVDLSRVFKALADPVRVRLLSLIASHGKGEACVCELTPRFELSQPTISHHLRILREAGLIDCERRGTWVYYWVVPGMLGRLGEVFGPAMTPTVTPAMTPGATEAVQVETPAGVAS